MYSASTLFRKAFSCCKDCYDQIYILSAKYGLLKPDEEIESYDVTLYNMSPKKEMGKTGVRTTSG
nr:DUF6884 domain-containing protein [Thermoactinomyces mirandus]